MKMETKTTFKYDKKRGLIIQRDDINKGKPTKLSDCHTGIIETAVECLNKHYDKELMISVKKLEKEAREYFKKHKVDFFTDGKSLYYMENGKKKYIIRRR